MAALWRLAYSAKDGKPLGFYSYNIFNQCPSPYLEFNTIEEFGDANNKVMQGYVVIDGILQLPHKTPEELLIDAKVQAVRSLLELFSKRQNIKFIAESMVRNLAINDYISFCGSSIIYDDDNGIMAILEPAQIVALNDWVTSTVSYTLRQTLDNAKQRINSFLSLEELNAFDYQSEFNKIPSTVNLLAL